MHTHTNTCTYTHSLSICLKLVSIPLGFWHNHMSVLGFSVLPGVSSCASPCLHRVFNEKLGEATSEIASSLRESESTVEEFEQFCFCILLPESAWILARFGNRTPPWPTEGVAAPGAVSCPQTCIFSGHGRWQEKMWHLREQCLFSAHFQISEAEPL